MDERVEGEERGPTAGPSENEHWNGYPGEADPQSYVVPARARYGFAFAILVFAVMLVAVAYMMSSSWQSR